MNMKADQGCVELQDSCASLPELVRMNYFHGQLISERDLRTEQDYFRARLRHANRCLHGYGVLCGLEVRPVPPADDCPPEGDERREALRRTIADHDRRIAELKAKDGVEDEVAKLAQEREALVRELEALEPHGHAPAPVGHRLELTCGAAIDCEGNDIILRHSVTVDLDALLKDDARNGEYGEGGEGHGEYGEGTGDHGDDARFAYLSICYRECGREPTRPFELDECATSLRCHNARMVEAWRLTASWHR
ncbi:MAG TPA: hypothetical protein VEA60_05105, partial [Allosphingosinicella sp.]|nr:hypothetical protein [Allosphingosinicella sp.]